MDLYNKRYAFTLVEEQRTDSGGYIPCIAIENELGYYPMSGNGECSAPWDWGKDRGLAQSLCDERNEKLGLSRLDAFKIITSSMFVKQGE